MNIKARPFSALDANEVHLWSRIQIADPIVDSPFLSAGFARAVAACRKDVEVAVLSDGGRTVGFLPFHRCDGDVGRPVGMRLSDLHGPVVEPGLDWDAGQLIRGASLTAWHFDHVPAAQLPLQRFHWGDASSPYIDLSRGFETYRAERRRAGSEQLHQVERKARKLEREVGPLRFEWHTTDPRVFKFLLEHKSEQRRRSRTFDVLELEWVVEVLDRLRTTASDDVSGVLSALYVGDRLVATHLGLRNRRVLHLWFPTFDRELHHHSPGLVLMVEMVKACHGQGIDCFHLGAGIQQFKLGLMTGSVPIATGSVATGRVSWAMGAASYRTRRWLGASPIRAALEIPDRVLTNWRQRAVMR